MLSGPWDTKGQRSSPGLQSSLILQMEECSQVQSPSPCRSRDACWSAWSAVNVSMSISLHHPAIHFLYTQHSNHSSLCSLAWVPYQSLVLTWTFV